MISFIWKDLIIFLKVNIKLLTKFTAEVSNFEIKSRDIYTVIFFRKRCSKISIPQYTQFHL